LGYYGKRKIQFSLGMIMILDMQRGRPSTKPRSAFGQRLVTAREKAGLSQAQVAARLGLSQRAIAHWERRSSSLYPEHIEALAKILQVSVEELVCNEPKHPRHPTGPTGKIRQVFEAASRLPRRQQNKVAEFIEAFVERQNNGHKQAA